MTIEQGHSAGDVVRDQFAAGEAWVIVVGGALDFDTIGPLGEALESVEQDRVVLDLSEVHFADSTAINLLLRFRSRADLHLVAPSAVVARLLSITGVDTILAIHDSLSTALTAPRSGPVAAD